jgi:hypothetical protein
MPSTIKLENITHLSHAVGELDGPDADGQSGLWRVVCASFLGRGIPARFLREDNGCTDEQEGEHTGHGISIAK